jgi:hypothetical protein
MGLTQAPISHSRSDRLGRYTRDSEIEYTADRIGTAVARLRRDAWAV